MSADLCLQVPLTPDIGVASRYAVRWFCALIFGSACTTLTALLRGYLLPYRPLRAPLGADIHMGCRFRTRYCLPAPVTLPVLRWTGSDSGDTLYGVAFLLGG